MVNEKLSMIPKKLFWGDFGQQCPKSPLLYQVVVSEVSPVFIISFIYYYLIMEL